MEVAVVAGRVAAGEEVARKTDPEAAVGLRVAADRIKEGHGFIPRWPRERGYARSLSRGGKRVN